MSLGQKYLPAVALIGVTVVWGSSFFLIRDLVHTIAPLDFLGLRFAIAALVIGAVRCRPLIRSTRRTWGRGIILGLVWTGAQIFQTYALSVGSASAVGVVTGMYVVLTPLILFLACRMRLSARVWAASALAMTGLVVLSYQGWSFGGGESLALVGAFLYAVHIVLLGRWSPKENGLDLAAIQTITLALVLGPLALPGGVTLPQTLQQWGVLMYMALVAGVGALYIQTWAQAHIASTAAAVIMTTEPVFAAAFAVGLGGETLTLRLLAGGGMIVAAMMINELGGASTVSRASGHSGGRPRSSWTRTRRR
ncbi:DMT family transporter [Schaalia suimastitidis]|uniref:DMT family transporter n=1 Tax=Schaalia suimastitidis TaxID=121163 RepID=UPI00040B16CF|nr:DMT family transporter [Schaalia suimastitidis]